MPHPYIYPSRALVFNLINRDNNTNFNPTDVELQNLRPYSKSGDFRNTALDVVGVEEEGMSGTVTVHYQRLDIGDVFANVDLRIRWDGQSDTLAVMKAVNALYGTRFNEDDVDITYFNPNTLPLTVNVQMRDTSLAWVGSVQVHVVAFSQSLADGLQTVVDPVFDYPTGQSTKAQGPLYLRPYSYDVYWTFLKGIGRGLLNTTDSQALLTILNSQLPPANQWVLSNTVVARNLATQPGQLSVLYVGRPLPEYTHRLNVGRILVITLNDTLCADVFGYLVMHFSDPTLDLDSSLVNKDIGEVPL
jgi:hypothetical protein